MWHATHLLELVDKICIYEIDLASVVEDTERTTFGLQTDGQTDGQRDGHSEINIPFSTLLAGVTNYTHGFQ